MDNYARMQENNIGSAPPLTQAMNIDPVLDAKITELYGMSRDSPIDTHQAAHWSQDDDVWRVVEFDNDVKVPFLEKLVDAQTCGALAMMYIAPVVFWPCVRRCVMNNARDLALAESVALTADGLRYRVAERDAGCRCQCTRKGAMTKMVPYDRLQDVEVDEPAGNSCFCIRNVISTVKVQTAAGGGVTANGQSVPEVTLRGLKRPHEFRRVMIALKKHAETAPGYRDTSGVGKGGANPPPYSVSEGNGVGGGGVESVALLGQMAGSAQRQEASQQRQEAMLGKHLDVLSDIASTLKTAHAVGV